MRNLWNHKLHITGKDYHRVRSNHARINKTSTHYFLNWNGGKIHPKDLDEFKIFTPADRFYIQQNKYE